MKYAILADGIVKNVISLDERNAHEFPGAVKLDDRAVNIGDTFQAGKFYNATGAEILTPMELRVAELETQLAAAKILLGVD